MEKKIDNLLQLNYLMFKNENNVCWLDASIALIAHNETFKKAVKSCPDSEINKLILLYWKAMSDSDHSSMRSPKILKLIQKDALTYLKQFLKFEHGTPDSAFCALLNFIYQDKSNIKEYVNVSWIWRKECSSCGINSKSSIYLKPIITFHKTDNFYPDCPVSTYICSCKSEQNMTLIYTELPPCLIFHFENGIRCGINLPLTFTVKGRDYQLTGIIILEKSSNSNLNHFVTWIRNPHFNMWLQCNDLKVDFTFFSPVKPEFDLKDVYITVYESFDDLHRIKNDEASVDLEEDVENSNVEFVYVSDEDFDAGKEDSYEAKTSNFLKSSNSEINESKDTSSDYNEKKSVHEVEIAASAVKNLEMNPESKKEISFENISRDNSAASNIISHEKHKNQIHSSKFECLDEAIGSSLKAKKGTGEKTDNQEQKNPNTSTYDNPKSGATVKNTSHIKGNSDFANLKKESKMLNHKNVNNVAGCDSARKKLRRKELKQEDKTEITNIVTDVVDGIFSNWFSSIMEKKKKRMEQMNNTNK